MRIIEMKLNQNHFLFKACAKNIEKIEVYVKGAKIDSESLSETE